MGENACDCAVARREATDGEAQRDAMGLYGETARDEDTKSSMPGIRDAMTVTGTCTLIVDSTVLSNFTTWSSSSIESYR